MTRRNLPHAPLLEAAHGRTPSRTPVWFMRQAGRSLPEYREVREGIAMLDSCFMPELLAEITLQPVRRHDVDAAILFSDIVVPLKAAGVEVEIVPGRGPVVAEAVRTRSDVDKLPMLDHEVSEVADGIRIILDASASMYHMQFDGRLSRELEAAMLIMEAMKRVDTSRFAFDMVAHSGDQQVIPLIKLNQLPQTDGDRFRILRDVVTIMRFCFSGDNTVECIEQSIKEVANDDNADDYFVIALSDANLARYHITPEALGHALKSNDKVKSAVIFIDKGPEAMQAAQILRGRAFVAQNTRDIPRILSDILTSMVAGQ